MNSTCHGRHHSLIGGMKPGMTTIDVIILFIERMILNLFERYGSLAIFFLVLDNLKTFKGLILSSKLTPRTDKV